MKPIFLNQEVEVYLKSPMRFNACEEHQEPEWTNSSVNGTLIATENGFHVVRMETDEGYMDQFIPVDNVAVIVVNVTEHRRLNLVN